MLARLGKAFTVGCFVGAVGQILILITGTFISDPVLCTMVSMLLFGIIVALVIASGLYNKIAAFGGVGASIPLCGLMHGAAMARVEEEAKGTPANKAAMIGFTKVITVLGIGFIISFILGVLL